MADYARIADGVVAELFTPPPGVVIADCFVVEVARTFVEVPAGVTPEQGWTFNGTSFAAPVVTPPPPPTLQQQAMALLAGPVNVACASVPALNGSYPLDAVSQAQITGIASAISAGLGLPSGAATFNWPDAFGAPHAWPAPQFTAFAKGVMQFLYAAAQVAQGHSTTLPSATLTLT
jgi:hypothetical protein